MSNCPYCNGANLPPSNAGKRERPETHTTVQCSYCMGYAVKHKNGRVFPLIDRQNPDADACTRVMDG